MLQSVQIAVQWKAIYKSIAYKKKAPIRRFFCFYDYLLGAQIDFFRRHNAMIIPKIAPWVMIAEPP